MCWLEVEDDEMSSPHWTERARQCHTPKFAHTFSPIQIQIKTQSLKTHYPIQGSKTRVWLTQRKISESMAPRHLIWLNTSHIIPMTNIKSHLKRLVTQLFRKSTVD